MFSDRWKTNDPIKIESCNFETFAEFLSFFYRGSCNLSESNIIPIVNLAEMYQVKPLKKLCDNYMVDNISISIENVLLYRDFAETYNLRGFKSYLMGSLEDDFTFLLNSEKFLNVPIDVIMWLFTLKRHYPRVESRLFEKVCYDLCKFMIL